MKLKSKTRKSIDTGLREIQQRLERISRQAPDQRLVSPYSRACRVIDEALRDGSHEVKTVVLRAGKLLERSSRITQSGWSL